MAKRLSLIGLVLTLSLASGAQTISLPCKEPAISVAADGSGLWLACSSVWEAENAARASNRPPRGAPTIATDLYWLETGKSNAAKLLSAPGLIKVFAAPSSASALVVETNLTKDRVLLFRGKEQVKELSLENTFFHLWNADAKKIYIYGGSTIQADAWDILGIYDLATNAITQQKLAEPTEILRVCQATGHVYSVTPQYPGFRGSTVEYTSSIRFVKRIHGWIGARFSANCKYVASESDFHGPLPWSIYDTSDGKPLYQFAYGDEPAKGDAYALVAWNPKYDSILMRDHIAKDGKETLEVFDVPSGRVLKNLGPLVPAAWSADGNNIIRPIRNELQWIPIKLGGATPPPSH